MVVFDEKGNLQYGVITKFIPSFSYAGRVNLEGKTKSEKLSVN